jgi:fluoride exporter
VSFVLLWLAVGTLGGLASAARFLIDVVVSAGWSGRLPAGTLLVNLSGSVILGLLVGIALSGDAYLLAGTAVIGSYTTFSSWLLESYRLGQDGRRWLLVVNIAASLVLGVAAVALGQLIAGG